MSKGPDTVYVLKSERHQDRFYTGITTDIAQRFEFHNAGLSKHTSTGCPWSVVVTLQFAEELRAQQFEYYLKTGSGRAFAARHFR
jgi:predicted GIY-YIG superfamily endonuclease